MRSIDDSKPFFDSTLLKKTNAIKSMDAYFLSTRIVGGDIPNIKGVNQQYNLKYYYFFVNDSVYIIDPKGKSKFLERLKENLNPKKEEILPILFEKRDKGKIRLIKRKVGRFYKWIDYFVKRSYNKNYSKSIYKENGKRFYYNKSDINRGLNSSSNGLIEDSIFVEGRKTNYGVVYNDTFNLGVMPLGYEESYHKYTRLWDFCIQYERSLVLVIRSYGYKILKDPFLEDENKFKIQNNALNENYLAQYNKPNGGNSKTTELVSILSSYEIAKNGKISNEKKLTAKESLNFTAKHFYDTTHTNRKVVAISKKIKPLVVSNKLIGGYTSFTREKGNNCYYYFNEDDVYLIDGEIDFLRTQEVKKRIKPHRLIKKLNKKQKRKKIAFKKRTLKYDYTITNTSYDARRNPSALYRGVLSKIMSYSVFDSKKKFEEFMVEDTFQYPDIEEEYAYIFEDDTLKYKTSRLYKDNQTSKDSLSYIRKITNLLSKEMLHRYKGSSPLDKIRWNIRTSPRLEIDNELELYNSLGEEFVCEYSIEGDTILIENPPLSIFEKGKVRIRRKRDTHKKEFSFKEEKAKIKFKEIKY